MIPISDPDNPRRHFPIANVLIILINVLVFVYELNLQFSGSRGAYQSFITGYGVVPQEIITGRDLAPLIHMPVWITLITSMFIHGGWLHILGNMLYLWVFGDNVEDGLGSLTYAIFYIACGLAGSLAHILSDPLSRTPSVGASGAIAGVLAAYVIFYPRAQVRTLVIFGFLFVRTFPALLVIGVWILMQLWSAFSGTEDGVAYMAHVGGFFAGLFMAFVLRGRARQNRSPVVWSPYE